MNATHFDQPRRPRDAAVPAAVSFDTGAADSDDARSDGPEPRGFRAAVVATSHHTSIASLVPRGVEAANGPATRSANAAARAAALAVLLAAGAAQAQSGRPPAGNTVTVGLGAGVSTDYEGADEYKLIPGGTLRGTVAGHDFFLRGLQLNFDAIPNGTVNGFDLSLGPVLGVRLNRNSRVEDARVAGLGELDAAVELGAFAAIGTANGFTGRNDNLALRVSYVRDVANAHKSHLVTPSIEYSRRFDRRTFATLSLSAEFAGDRYARYYFDVSTGRSAASGLRPHAAKGGLKSLGGSIVVVRALSDRPKGWSLFGIASYGRLQGDFARSPIVADVGSANQAFVFGVNYLDRPVRIIVAEHGALGISYTF